MRRILTSILAFLLLFCLESSFTGCSKNIDDFSEEEHIQRITERIEKRNSNWVYPEEENYQDFKVSPLYNKNDELKYFLVEFEPYGFVFISIQDEPSIFNAFFNATKSMYVVSADLYGRNNPWTPYTKDKNSPTLPSLIDGWETDRKGDLILDENGEMIIYDKSPYFVTGNIDEKKYLLETDCSYEFICAVKEDGKFINLISGVVLSDSEEYNYANQATLIVRYIANKEYDL